MAAKTVRTLSRNSPPRSRPFFSGFANGSFGELLQGVLPGNGSHFLVSLPIKNQSTAYFFPHKKRANLPRSPFTISPNHKKKALLLAERLAKQQGIAVNGTIKVVSDIPVGKGLSSSSADMVAIARALSAYTKQSLTPEMLAHLLTQIEPTDSVMYAGSTVYGQQKGQLLQHLGKISPLAILSLDEGGRVNTLKRSHHPDLPPHYRRHQASFGELLQQLQVAFRGNDLQAIGRIATASADIHQDIFPKQHLAGVKHICELTGGLGVINTHSGTCLGILYDQRNAAWQRQLKTAQKALSQWGQTSVYHTL